MHEELSFTKFKNRFPDDDACLDEIKRRRYEGGVYCKRCKMLTRHYRVRSRPIFACKFCRKQVAPLAGTIFEKTTTPLLYWFYVMFLMTQTRANISAKTIQRELGVTYKTAWRMRSLIYGLMKKNKGDLLSDVQVRRWVFFNKLELKVVRKTSY